MNLQWVGRLLHLLGFAATLCAAAAFILFVYRPMEAESAKLSGDWLQREAYLKTSQKIRGRNNRLKQELAGLQSQLVRLGQKIPAAPHEADFLAQLSSAADETRVEIRDYRPGSVTEQDGYSELVIHVSANGTYAGLCRFLDRLEHLPRLCHVTMLGVDAPETSGGTYSFDLTLRVFFAPERQSNPTKSAKERQNG